MQFCRRVCVYLATNHFILVLIRTTIRIQEFNDFCHCGIWTILCNSSVSPALAKVCSLPVLLSGYYHYYYEKKRSEETQTLRAGCSNVDQKFRPAADPLPGGAERPKFNQLEMVTTFTYKPSLVRIDARNFELSW